jgi:pimeloyl-ACP methyl ester carboxylesterase
MSTAGYEYFTTHDGLSIAYKVSGEGPPVVLVHGAIVDSARNWSIYKSLNEAGEFVVGDGPTIEGALIDAGYQVVMLDRRGHGRSDKPHDRESYSMDACRGDVRSLVEHLDIQQAALMGYSAGAWIALGLLHDPWLSAAILGGVGSWAVDGVDDDFYSDNTKISSCFLADKWDDPSLISARNRALLIPRSDFVALGQSFLGYDTTSPDDLSSVSVPSMVLNGGGDDGCKPEWDLSAYIPNSLNVIAGDGDHVFAINDPLFLAAIVNFLNGNRL